MTNSISPGALRAAQQLCDNGLSRFGFKEEMAREIDKASGLPELLEALREIDAMLKGEMPITAQVKAMAQTAIKKFGGTI